jgi:hypothetical protein
MRVFYAGLAFAVLSALQAFAQPNINAGTGSFAPPSISSGNATLDHFAPGAIDSHVLRRFYNNKYDSTPADPDPHSDCPLKRDWTLPY